MKERDFENILERYPDLIEDGLTLEGRQFAIGRRHMDLVFRDKYGQRLIIELKKGPILREHIAQIFEYEGDLLTPDDPTVRVMLVGNRVPPNLRRSLEHHGFEWRELTMECLAAYIRKKGDNQFENLFEDVNSSSAKITKNETESSAQCADLQEDVFPVPDSGNTQQASSRSITPREQELINSLPAELQQVYLEMRKRAMAFGSDVETYGTKNVNLTFKARYRFAVIQQRVACLCVYVRPEGFNIPENTSAQVYGITVTRTPSTHLFNHQFEIDGNSPMDGVEKLLRQSYNAVKR